MTSNHTSKTQENTLHPLGGQPYVRQRRDGAGAQAIAIAEPEDDAIALQVFTCGNHGELIVNLAKKDAAVHGTGSAGGGCHREEGGRVMDRLSHRGTTLFGESGLEVIVRNVPSNDLQETKDRVWVARLERSKQPAIIVAELEVGFLDEIIESLAGGFPEVAGSAKDGCRDDRLKTADEFLPYCRVVRAGTGFNQIVWGKRRIP